MARVCRGDKMGEVHDIRVKCPYEILYVEDIKIECKPNEHGYLYLKCLIDDSIQFNSTINAETDDKIYVYEGSEDNVLFNGIVKNIKTNHFNDEATKKGIIIRDITGRVYN